MLAVCVSVEVTPGSEEAFLEATRANASATAREPGALRFDVLQDREASTRFLLYEVYADDAGAAAHKETPHYAAWRDAVEPMMARPRSSVKYEARFPDAPAAWTGA